MEIKDLRIGNVVWHLTTNNSEDFYYRYSEVVGFFDGDIVELKEHYREGSENVAFRIMYTAKEIQGFPLNSKILRNNGFAVNGKGLTFSECNSLTKDGKKTGLFCSFEKVYIPLSGSLRIKAEYVHTFQKQDRNERKYANHSGSLIYPDISRFMDEQCTTKVRVEILLTKS